MTSIAESLRLIKKWGTIQLVLYITCAIGLYFFWDPSYLWMTFIGYMIISVFGLDIGHHRYFCHNSFTCSKPVEWFLFICTIFVGAGPTGFWTALHRYHHKYSDTDTDPHRPFDQPILCYFHCNDRSRCEFEWKMAGDLINKPEHLFILKYYNYVYFSSLAVLFFINPYLALYGFVIPAILALNASGLLNVFCHRPYAEKTEVGDHSMNNLFVAIVTSGAGNHKNHHINPTSYTTKVKDNEYDLSGWIIRKFLATSVKT